MQIVSGNTTDEILLTAMSTCVLSVMIDSMMQLQMSEAAFMWLGGIRSALCLSRLTQRKPKGTLHRAVLQNFLLHAKWSPLRMVIWSEAPVLDQGSRKSFNKMISSQQTFTVLYSRTLMECELSFRIICIVAVLISFICTGSFHAVLLALSKLVGTQQAGILRQTRIKQKQHHHRHLIVTNPLFKISSPRKYTCKIY